MGCRTSAEKSALVRVVFDGEAFVIDARQSAPGRGAYLHAGCGARAARTRAVPRALRVAAGAPGPLDALLAALDASAAWAHAGEVGYDG